MFASSFFQMLSSQYSFINKNFVYGEKFAIERATREKRKKSRQRVWAQGVNSEENGNWYEMKGNFKRRKSNNNKAKKKMQAMKMKNLNEKFQTPK